MIGPVIILVESQIPQNIGKTARAMLNCELRDLRLVRPLVDPCHRDARALAAGGHLPRSLVTCVRAGGRSSGRAFAREVPASRHHGSADLLVGRPWS